MKKLSIILSCILGLATLFGGCEKEKLPGSVYGVVTDKATGDPIINAGVELQPVGLKTVTGSDGRFEFNEIEAGTYNVFISKTGYTSFKSDDIEVKEGKQTQYDVQMEKLPASLRVVDNNNNDIDSLDFGNQTSDVARSFNIFNDGPESIEWEITKTANWISGLSKESGTLSPGATQAVIVTIDRSLLQSGENTTTLHITSNNGSKQLTVLAVNGTVLPTLNTLNVTNIHSTSATLNGKILTAGTPSYTERGFVYSTSSTPTIENAIAQLTSPVTTSPDFSATATGLTTGATYYVRAYAINEAGTAYSTNVVNFQTQMSLPTVTTQNVTNVDVGAGSVTMNGNITNAGDPAYTERGFVFGTIHNPTLESDSSKVVPGVGTGSYSTNLTGLTLNTTYYIRAYATNAMGTAYGNEITVAFSGDLAMVSTENPTNVDLGAGTATLNGTIQSVGNPAYTERGFVYGVNHNPTVENDAKSISAGSGTGAYSSNITGLTLNTIYYVRAYATNLQGTAYGNEITINLTGTLPSVNTGDVSSINLGAGTAIFNGTITNAGDPAYTERGFVYGVNHNPTVENDAKSISAGSGTGAFSSNVSGLAINTVYYVRAYATNLQGTAYGNEITINFTGTLPSVNTANVSSINLGAGTAIFNGTIVNAGDPAYTERGFVYGTMHNPTVENDTKSISAGSGTGAYSSNITGLTLNTTYYIRAYATSAMGTAYGSEVVLDFVGTLPTLTTNTVTNLDYTLGTAKFNGVIETEGDPAYSERGFVYGLTHNPTVENDTKKTATGLGTGNYTVNVSGLSLNTTYYIRAYATSAMGTAYGNEIELNFVGVIPTVSTSAATNIHIGAGTATFNGTIVNAGDPAYTERGFVYGVMHNPTIDDTKRTVSGNGTGAYYANVTNLVAGTTYYIRAYATNQQGTAYGEEVTMAFNPVMPELTTSTATNLSMGNQTATFNGTIVSVGDPAYTERGFVYGYMHNPTIEDDSKKVSPGNGMGAFSVNATGLEVGRTYYIRAYATSAFGTSYGNEVALDFSAILPTVTTLAVSNNVNGGATFNGNITNVGDPAYTERGFVYGTMSSPTIDDATVSVVSGTALGTYTKTVSNLNNGATYYVRAYAKNASNQVAYGTVVSFVVRPVYLLRGGGPGGIDLYVALSDEGSFKWSRQYNITGATNPSDGSANMEVIRAINPDLSGYPAFKACSDMGSGWYLPSKDELNQLYLHKTEIGGFPDEAWYSSTENGSSKAWSQYFANGTQGDFEKDLTGRVRCVRRVY